MKKQKVKFKDLSKKDKIFKIVNLSLMGMMIAVIAGIIIYYAITGDPNKRIWAGAVIILYTLVPYLVEFIFRTRVPNVLFLGIEIYIIVAGIWGSLLQGYDTIPALDIIVHTLMGYLVAMVGIYIISRITNYKKLSPVAVILFCFFFSLGVELIWELAEWGTDLIIGQNAQGPKVVIDDYGRWVPAVTDTMIDLLCNFSGAFVFMIHYLIGKYTKCSLGIKTIESELAKGFKESIVEYFEGNHKFEISTLSESIKTKEKENNDSSAKGE